MTAKWVRWSATYGGQLSVTVDSVRWSDSVRQNNRWERQENYQRPEGFTPVPIPHVKSNLAHSYNLATVDTLLAYVAAPTL